MKNLHINRAIVMLWLFVISFSGCLFSCNAVKRVNKDVNKQLKVIKDYSLKRGFKNDTTYIFSGTDSVITERTDTVINEKITTINDTNILYRTIYKTRTITKLDTIQMLVNNTSTAQAMQDVIRNNESIISECKIRYEQIKSARDKWRLRFYILVIAIGSFITILIIKR